MDCALSGRVALVATVFIGLAQRRRGFLATKDAKGTPRKARSGEGERPANRRKRPMVAVLSHAKFAKFAKFFDRINRIYRIGPGAEAGDNGE